MGDKVKLQVPVPSEVVHWLDGIATKHGVSRAALAGGLIETMLEEREKFLEWKLWQVLGGTVYLKKQIIKSFKGKPRRPQGNTVHIAVFVAPPVAEQLEARGMETRSESRGAAAAFASELLQSAVDCWGMLFNIGSTKPVMALFRVLGIKELSGPAVKAVEPQKARRARRSTARIKELPE